MTLTPLNTDIQTPLDIEDILSSYKKLNGFLIGRAENEALKIIRTILETDNKEEVFVKSEIQELAKRNVIKHHPNDQIPHPSEIIKLWDQSSNLDLPESDQRDYSTLKKMRLGVSKNKQAPSQRGQLAVHAPILIASLKDQKVKNKTFDLIDTHIIFENEGGFCRGMSHWFLLLYFLLRPIFKSQKDCLTAVTSAFKNGAENESILIQSLCIKNGKILNLQIDTYLKNRSSMHISSETIYQSKSAANLFSKLNCGSYLLKFLFHECVYVRLSKDHAFYFDPNKGLFELSPKTHDHDLLVLLKENCENESDHFVEFVHCQPRKSFPRLTAEVSNHNLHLLYCFNTLVLVLFLYFMAMSFKN